MNNTSTSSVRATNKLIPELRFPEFVYEGEWEETIVCQVVEYENGKAHEQDIVEQGKYVVVNSKFISTDGEIRKFSNSANCLAKKNEILMVLSDVPNGRAIAKCYYVDKDDFYTVNQRICKLTPVNVDSKLLLYLLNRNRFFLAFDDGVKQTNLRNEDVMNCPIILPKNPTEQQKIASCLSSLDEVIASHNQKLDALKEHKKGLMQNLFPQEGETVPKYRFKEFVNDGEWVEKTLGSIAEIVTGSTPSTIETINYNGTRLFVSPADINDNRYITQTKTTLSDVGFSKTRKIKANSVLFVCIGSTIGKIAQNKFECATNQQLNSLIPYEGNSSDFLYSILDNNSTKIASIAGNHAVPIINKTSFSAIKLSFPPKPNEQQKIASCLSSLDDLITSQVEKIEQLKLHKKGLMQGLFPRG